MLKRFFAYDQPYKGLSRLDFGRAAPSGLLELGCPIAVKLFIDTLSPAQQWGFVALAALVPLSRGRTTLVVAHRLATIRNADRFVVVDERGVVEQGRRQDLVVRAGPYSSLHEAQAR